MSDDKPGRVRTRRVVVDILILVAIAKWAPREYVVWLFFGFLIFGTPFFRGLVPRREPRPPMATQPAPTIRNT